MPASSEIELIKTIQRGIAGHLTFTAATQSWGTLFELALYSPIGSILSANQYKFVCQFPLAKEATGVGAPRSIDFVARKQDSPRSDWTLAMEAKLLAPRGKQRTIDITSDVDKLNEFKASHPNVLAFVIIFGRQQDIDRTSCKTYKDGRVVALRDREKSKIVADVGRTKWGSVFLKI